MWYKCKGHYYLHIYGAMRSFFKQGLFYVPGLLVAWRARSHWGRWIKRDQAVNPSLVVISVRENCLKDTKRYSFDDNPQGPFRGWKGIVQSRPGAWDKDLLSTATVLDP